MVSLCWWSFWLLILASQMTKIEKKYILSKSTALHQPTRPGLTKAWRSEQVSNGSVNCLDCLDCLGQLLLSLNRPNRPTWYITLITLLPKHSASMAEKNCETESQREKCCAGVANKANYVDKALVPLPIMRRCFAWHAMGTWIEDSHVVEERPKFLGPLDAVRCCQCLLESSGVIWSPDNFCCSLYKQTLTHRSPLLLFVTSTILRQWDFKSPMTDTC